MEQQNKHFVYAIDIGTYDADGNAVRIFGHSSLKSIEGRYNSYNTNALRTPILCGVIVCDDKQHAYDTEKAILERLWKDAPSYRPKSELRLASDDVLNFIATEMEDGETFLGMSFKAYANQQRNAYARKRRAKREDVREKERAYKQRPDVKAKNNAYTREYCQRADVKEHRKAHKQKPDVKARNRELERKRRQQPHEKAKRKAYEQKPEVRMRRRANERRRYREKKSGGNSPGQMSFLP